MALLLLALKNEGAQTPNRPAGGAIGRSGVPSGLSNRICALTSGTGRSGAWIIAPHLTALLLNGKGRQFFAFKVKHKTQMLRMSPHPDTAQERIFGRIGH